MSSLAYVVGDSATMLRRNVRRMVRYPSMTLLLVGLPVVFLLLFVYVFGGTMGAGLGGPSGGRAEYVAYITPAILLIAVMSAVQGTAISVAMDMTQGIVARFRTMAISKSAVLIGHVIGSMIQTALCVIVVFAVALLIGFRPDASAAEWAGVIGLLALMSFAFAWLTVACGLASPSVEAASNLPLPLTFLPFLGSGFVPTESMPAGLRWFAEVQPLTPINDTLRELLAGSAGDLGTDAALAVGWCLLIALASYLWAMRLYGRNPARRNAA